MDSTITVNGIPVDNLTRTQAVERILDLILSGNGHYIVFVNAEAVVLAEHNPAFRRALERAALRLVDGTGMQTAARLQGKRFAGNCNGTDLFPGLCKALQKQHLRIFLLGGKSGRAEKTAEWIQTAYPGVDIAGTSHGYLSEKDQHDLLTRIQNLRPDLLLVGFGAPDQELWISEHYSQTHAKVTLGVGGLFDFYSGSIPRAPLIIRKYGFEWVWRILREPKRFPRLIRLFEFVYIILKYKNTSKYIS